MVDEPTEAHEVPKGEQRREAGWSGEMKSRDSLWLMRFRVSLKPSEATSGDQRERGLEGENTDV